MQKLNLKKFNLRRIAPIVAAVALSVTPALAQTTTTPTSVDYGQLFAAANVTQNLPEMAGYVCGATLGFTGLMFAVRWIRRVVR